MSPLTHKQRLKIAFGGFLSFLGILLLIITFLVVIEKINIENYLKPELFIYAMAIIGALDILAGFLLFHSK